MVEKRVRRRAVRSDSIANRERLLSGAEAYFAERGLDASLHGLAEWVGVGIGTLYRHFPTHADLVRALYDRAVERLDMVAARCAECLTGWQALETFIDGTVEASVAFPATGEIMRRQAANDPTYRPGVRWEEPLLGYVARAKAEGILRADVAATDIAVIPSLLSMVRYYPEPARGVVLARQRALILDGLRAAPDEGGDLPLSATTANEHHNLAHGVATPPAV